MDQLANKKEFYKNFTLFFITSLVILIWALKNIFSFAPFFDFLGVSDWFAFFCALFYFFIAWRSLRVQKTSEFLSFETVRDERKKLKQDKQRILLFPNAAQNNDLDTQAAKIFTQKDAKIRSSLLWGLCYCEWLMSYKAQRACFFYLLSNLFYIATQIIPNYGLLTLAVSFFNACWVIAGIIAFLYWIVSVVEAA